MSCIVDDFRRSLDEPAVGVFSDACVSMEEDFLLELICDLDPSQPVYCKTTGSRKGACGRAQRKKDGDPESEDSIQVDLSLIPRPNGLMEYAESDSDSSMSSFSGSVTGSFSEQGEWRVDPVVTPEQMMALGRMVKAQRSTHSVDGSASFSSGDTGS